MIDPKQFYRKMDRMLARIANEGHDGRFLQRILEELVLSFGEELYFGNGHMYRELFGVYELLHTTGQTDVFPARLSVSNPAVENVLKHGAFLYESPSEIPSWYVPGKGDAPEFVAFRLDGPPGHRYLFLFTLRPGWVRDELAFCLNGVRFSLNYRLKADAAQGELDTAAAIQNSLLPQKAPDFPGFDIAVRSQPAEAVGGDLYDFLMLEEDMMGIAMGDASGHGLPAALLVRDVLMGIRMGVGSNLKMMYTLKKLNRVIHETTFSTRFVSVFFGELNSNGGLLYANAGHTSGLILHEGKIVRLDPTGPIMGPLPDIPPGGIMILYTDGITERNYEDGEPFEEEGLIRCILDFKDESAATIVKKVFDYALSLDHQSDILEDDSTLMVIKRSA
jgi:sigma-B regulation protein RsbU (phosphoserine phosphatase)